MANYKVFKLHFRSPLHIGLGRSTYDSSSSELHSDTITAALAAIKAQHGTNEDKILEFLNSFCMSSAFPFEGEMYFLPKPLTADRINVNGTDGTEFRKELKKIRFIESSVWKNFIEATTPSIVSDQMKKEYVVPLSCKKFVPPFKMQETQRVSVNRSGEKPAEPFFFEWCFFDTAHDCGLYVIVDAEEDIILELRDLFKELGESGIGTDKSVGGGQFEVTSDNIELPSADGDAWMSLSLYLPSLEEQTSINMLDSYYNITRRGGYMAGSSNPNYRHLWKKSIYMYEEGSVFYTKAKPNGTVVNLQPQWNSPEKMHPVYRSGKALFIPIKTVQQ